MGGIRVQFQALERPYPIHLTGGTGRFAGAAGDMTAIGEVDLLEGTVFRYGGEVCSAAPGPRLIHSEVNSATFERIRLRLVLGMAYGSETEDGRAQIWRLHEPVWRGFPNS